MEWFFPSVRKFSLNMQEVSILCNVKCTLKNTSLYNIGSQPNHVNSMVSIEVYFIKSLIIGWRKNIQVMTG